MIFYPRGQLELAPNLKSPEIPKNPQTILQFRAKIAGEDGPLKTEKDKTLEKQVATIIVFRIQIQSF